MLLEPCILLALKVLMCIYKTLVGHVMCLKRLKTVTFERSEPFHLLRMMGVSVPSLHIESTDSMISRVNNKEEESVLTSTNTCQRFLVLPLCAFNLSH